MSVELKLNPEFIATCRRINRAFEVGVIELARRAEPLNRAFVQGAIELGRRLEAAQRANRCRTPINRDR
jgi:hypothetical protein